MDARSAREWSSGAAARAICPNSLRRRCCISEETGGCSVCDRTDTLVTCAVYGMRRIRRKHHWSKASRRCLDAFVTLHVSEDMADPLEICFSPHVLPCQIQSFHVKLFEHNYGDLPQNFDPFQGHSRSLKPTRIDRISDFLIVFYSNYGPISYRFRDKGLRANVSYPRTFNAPADGVPLGIL